MSIKQKIKLWWNGIREEEFLALDTARSLYRILSATPALAQRMFDLLPAILTEMKRLERSLPETGRGRERLGELVQWVETEHGEGLQKIAQLGEIIAVTRAIATLIVSFLKASGIMRQ
jgi:hypothetical protein